MLICRYKPDLHWSDQRQVTLNLAMDSLKLVLRVALVGSMDHVPPIQCGVVCMRLLSLLFDPLLEDFYVT